MNKSEQSQNQAPSQRLQQKSFKGQAIVVEKPVDQSSSANNIDKKPREINGPKGLEPTRYGDWEANGRCYDF